MLIVGITGGTGCGKTTIVNEILNEFSEDEVGSLSQDAYYKDTSYLSYDERIKINFDHPNSIDFDLLITHLQDLKNKKTIDQPVYSFVKHNRTGYTIKINPKKIIIVEGILIFSNTELRDLFDVKIFIHTDSDERLIRRLKRDMSERGRDLEEVLSRYQSTSKPMYNEFIEPVKACADIVISNNTYNTAPMNIIKKIITEKL